MESLILSSLMLFVNIEYIHMLLTRKKTIRYAAFVFTLNFLLFIFGILFCYTFFTVWVFSSAILILCFDIINLCYVKDFNLYRFYLGVLRLFIELILMPIIYLYCRPQYKEMLKIVSNKVINIIAVYASLIFLFLINYYELQRNIRIGADKYDRCCDLR